MHRFPARFEGSLLAFFGILLQACSVEPQDPNLIFNRASDFPPTLAAIANPNPNAQPELLSVIRNKNPQGRVGVAVIDNGVDYLHRDLRSQIRFNTRNGQIQGAGFDALGGDFAAHSNLINANLFGLMAQKIENGQLTGVQGDPLTWMNQVQNEFVQIVLTNLGADASLKGTLAAAKFNAGTVSFFALSMPTLLKKWQITYQKEFKRNQRDGKLLTFKEPLAPLYREYGQFAVDSFLNEKWILDSGLGYPEELSNSLFLRYSDAEKIFVHLAKAFNDVDAKYRITPRLQNYVTYRNATDLSIGTQDLDFYLSDLVTSWLYARNFTSASPLLEMINSICQGLPEDAVKQLRGTQLTPDQRWGLFRAAFVRNLDTINRVTKRRVEIEAMNADEKKSLLKGLTTINHWTIMLDEIFTQRPYLRAYLTCHKDLLLAAPQDPGLSKFVQARKHPYLSATSESESHGTHVSGIIAKQSLATEIVPVRVATATVAPLPLQVQRIRANFDRGFAAWMGVTSIAQGIGNSRLAQGIFKRSLSQSELMAGMKKFVDEEMFNNYLDFLFFEQIKLAIQYVGSQKIKVANMSLGTNFNKVVVTPDKKDFEELVNSFYTFVLYEYFKFDVAVALQKYAKNTLFVIASGNDGAWLDGNSKSGLPCDLSSPVLAQVPNLPNNQVRNILCVGSMDDTKLLSSFTNIPLTSVPFVLSYGEAILSPIKTTDCSGAQVEYMNQLGKTENLSFTWEIDPLETRFDDLLKNSGFWKMDPFNPDVEGARKLAALSVANFGITVSAVQQGMTQHRCMKVDRNNMGRMSGTSMATPAVTGFIAKVIGKKLNLAVETRGKTDAQIYDDPNFAPETLIKELLTASPAFGGNSLIKDVKMIPEIMRWKPAQARLNSMVGVRVTDLLRAQ